MTKAGKIPLCRQVGVEFGVPKPDSGPIVYIFGAGASHGYEGSRTEVSPPLAGNFFSTFYRLLVSQDLEVKIGDIVNYLRDTQGIDPVDLPAKFDGNIETVFAELHDRTPSRIDA